MCDLDMLFDLNYKPFPLEVCNKIKYTLRFVIKVYWNRTKKNKWKRNSIMSISHNKSPGPFT